MKLKRQAIRHSRALALLFSRFLARNVLARLYAPSPAQPPVVGAIPAPPQARLGTGPSHGPASGRSGQMPAARLGAAVGPASGHRAAPGTAPAHRL